MHRVVMMQVLPYSFIYFFYTIYFYLFFISYLEVYRKYILCIGDLKPLSCKAFERTPTVHICVRHTSESYIRCSFHR